MLWAQLRGWANAQSFMAHSSAERVGVQWVRGSFWSPVPVCCNLHSDACLLQVIPCDERSLSRPHMCLRTPITDGPRERSGSFWCKSCYNYYISRGRGSTCSYSSSLIISCELNGRWWAGIKEAGRARWSLRYRHSHWANKMGLTSIPPHQSISAYLYYSRHNVHPSAHTIPLSRAILKFTKSTSSTQWPSNQSKATSLFLSLLVLSI